MKRVYKVYLSMEVIAEDTTAEDVKNKVQDLLEHGTVVDVFDSAGLDASYFLVEKVEV
jgi:hypothetical protein